jgi:hypothetical protein
VSGVIVSPASPTSGLCGVTKKKELVFGVILS